MKKNLAKMALQGVNNTELVNMLVEYLNPTQIESLVYHFSGDQELYTEMPEVDNDRIVAYIEKRHNRPNTSINEVKFVCHEQAIQVSYEFDDKGWFEEGKSQTRNTARYCKSDIYTIEATFRNTNTCTIPLEAIM